MLNPRRLPLFDGTSALRIYHELHLEGKYSSLGLHAHGYALQGSIELLEELFWILWRFRVSTAKGRDVKE